MNAAMDTNTLHTPSPPTAMSLCPPHTQSTKSPGSRGSVVSIGSVCGAAGPGAAFTPQTIEPLASQELEAGKYTPTMKLDFENTRESAAGVALVCLRQLQVVTRPYCTACGSSIRPCACCAMTYRQYKRGLQASTLTAECVHPCLLALSTLPAAVATPAASVLGATTPPSTIGGRPAPSISPMRSFDVGEAPTPERSPAGTPADPLPDSLTGMVDKLQFSANKAVLREAWQQGAAPSPGEAAVEGRRRRPGAMLWAASPVL